MASGFQGPGYFDANGNWIDGVPGQTINTPNSSTGQPAYKDPSATFSPDEFATPQGGQVATRPQFTPNSSTGAPAPGIRNLPATINGGAAPISTIPGFGGKLSGAAGTAISALANGPQNEGDLIKSADAANNWRRQFKLGKWLKRQSIDHADRAQMQEFWRHPYRLPKSLASQAAPSDPQRRSQSVASRSGSAAAAAAIRHCRRPDRPIICRHSFAARFRGTRAVQHPDRPQARLIPLRSIWGRAFRPPRPRRKRPRRGSPRSTDPTPTSTLVRPCLGDSLIRMDSVPMTLARSIFQACSTIPRSQLPRRLIPLCRAPWLKLKAATGLSRPT